MTVTYSEKDIAELILADLATKLPGATQVLFTCDHDQYSKGRIVDNLEATVYVK